MLFVLIVLSACAPKYGADSRAGGAVDAFDLPELACRDAILKLDTLIEKRSADKNFPAARLIEAMELRNMGRRLYLEREYALALELIEDGIRLVENEGD